MLPVIESALLSHIRSRWIASGRALETLQFPNARHDPRATDFFAAIDLIHTDANRELIVGSEDRSGRRYTGLVVLRIFARRGDGTLELSRAADLVEDILSERRLPLHDPESERVVPDHWTDAAAVWELDDEPFQYTARDSVANRIAALTEGSVVTGRTGVLDLAADMNAGLGQYGEGFAMSDFTLCAWTKFEGPGAVSSTLFSFGTGNGDKFDLDGTDAIWKESNAAVARSNDGATPDVWEHWAVRREGSQMTIFRNGVALALNVDLPSAVSVSGFPFVFSAAGGRLDQVAVFDSAVPDADIASIYNAGVGSRYASPASFRGTLDLGVSRVIHVGPSEFEGRTWYQYNVETAMSATIFPRG